MSENRQKSKGPVFYKPPARNKLIARLRRQLPRLKTQLLEKISTIRQASSTLKTTPRPAVLILIVALNAAVFLILDRYLDGGGIYQQVFFPVARTTSTEQPEWQHLIQVVTVVLSLPAAFVLWHWRDTNVRHQIENHRKDTNLSEFQEFQLRAAGALASDLDEGGRITLQIAALHQLRGYLRGEYGKSFQRPTFELYSALLERSVKSSSDSHDKEITLNHRVYREVRSLVSEEWKYFFRSGFPLSKRSFDGLHLPQFADLSDLIFDECTFRFSVLDEVNLERCSLKQSAFDSSSICGTKFADSDLRESNFVGAKAIGADFRGAIARDVKAVGADFSYARLEMSDFSDAIFDQAYLRRAKLSGARLEFKSYIALYVEEAVFDNDSHLAPFPCEIFDSLQSMPPWLGCDQEEKTLIRDTWQLKKAKFRRHFI